MQETMNLENYKFGGNSMRPGLPSDMTLQYSGIDDN